MHSGCQHASGAVQGVELDGVGVAVRRAGDGVRAEAGTRERPGAGHGHEGRRVGRDPAVRVGERAKGPARHATARGHGFGGRSGRRYPGQRRRADRKERARDKAAHERRQ